MANPFKYESTEKMWTTRDGRKLKITEMDTKHIENCIFMLLRNIDQINTQLVKYGDGLWDEVLEELIQSISWLNEELQNRKEPIIKNVNVTTSIKIEDEKNKRFETIEMDQKEKIKRFSLLELEDKND